MDWGGLRKRIHAILELSEKGDVASTIVDRVLVVLILTSVACVIIDTVPGIKEAYGSFFLFAEMAIVLVFSVEYVLRVWSITAEGKYAHPLLGRLRYAVSPMALIDLCAILPFYLPMVMPQNMLLLRVFRLLRLMRLLKLGRYSESIQAMSVIFRKKASDLGVALMLIVFLIVISSSLMYFVENEAQPEAFPSIPHAMWWSVATLTTVGYGDIYPVTPLGKLLAAVISILGIGLFAVPAGILSSGYTEYIQDKHCMEVKCPHCGEILKK